MISVDSWRSRAVSAAVTGEDEEPEPILGVILTPAFAERTRISPSYEVVHVDLADPAGDLAGFQQAVRAAHPDASLSFLARRDREAVVAVATKPYVQSLRIFAVVLALTALLVLGQALARQAAADGADGAALAALGLGPREVAGVAMTRAALAGAAGTVMAAGGAWLASSRFPVGPTRLAEPHTLVTGLQRQRRTLAVLKTLGFVRRQVSATVAWHATTVVTIALAVGVPLGVAAGRLAWGAFTDDLGAGGPPVTPAVALLGVVAGGYLLANLLAAGPARRARRIPPAVVLRSE